MNDIIELRVTHEANHIIETGATVRATAAEFGTSKSTVHKDMVERLAKVKPALYDNVIKILEFNKNDRHNRGGEATRKKYQLMSEMEDIDHGNDKKKSSNYNR